MEGKRWFGAALWKHRFFQMACMSIRWEKNRLGSGKSSFGVRNRCERLGLNPGKHKDTIIFDSSGGTTGWEYIGWPCLDLRTRCRWNFINDSFSAFIITIRSKGIIRVVFGSNWLISTRLDYTIRITRRCNTSIVVKRITNWFCSIETVKNTPLYIVRSSI